MPEEDEIVTLFRPTGPTELALVRASGWKRWLNDNIVGTIEVVEEFGG